MVVGVAGGIVFLESKFTERRTQMYQITKISIELLSLPELLEARNAIQILRDIGIQEVDIDVTRLVNELIMRKEQDHA